MATETMRLDLPVFSSPTTTTLTLLRPTNSLDAAIRKKEKIPGKGISLLQKPYQGTNEPENEETETERDMPCGAQCILAPTWREDREGRYFKHVVFR